MESERVKKFHDRFSIEVGQKEAQRRFLNRVSNGIFEEIAVNETRERLKEILRAVANSLGEVYWGNVTDARAQLNGFVEGDFYTCLQVLEAIYATYAFTGSEDGLSDAVERTLSRSEVDLGVAWQPPHFVPTGAQLLDDKLVNDSLNWLSESGYKPIYDPFSKGLSHFLESTKKPHLLSDVITDMYEALEATAKLLVGNDKDLSANRERFVSRLPVSEMYKRLLKEYVEYANEYRHGVNESKPRPQPKRAEVESFVYLTGLFIRLAVESTSDRE